MLFNVAGRSSVHLFCTGTTQLFLCGSHGAFASAAAGVLVAGVYRERQLCECAPWPLLFSRSLLTFIFF